MAQPPAKATNIEDAVRRIRTLEAQVKNLTFQAAHSAKTANQTKVQIITGNPATGSSGGASSSSITNLVSATGELKAPANASDVMNTYISAFPAGLLVEAVHTISPSAFLFSISASAATLVDADGNFKTISNVAVGHGQTVSTLDTGSWAANTLYWVFLIYNPTTDITSDLFSLSATAPVLPSGYTYSRLVSAVITSASSPPIFYPYTQTGNQWGLYTPYLLTSTLETSWTAIPLPSSSMAGTVGGITLLVDGTSSPTISMDFSTVWGRSGQVWCPISVHYSTVPAYQTGASGTVDIYLEAMTLNI